MTTPLSSTAPEEVLGDRTRSAITRFGLVAAIAGVITLAGFASDYAVIAPYLVESGSIGALGGWVAFVVAVVTLAALHWAAAREISRGPRRRGFAGALLAVSIVGAIFFAWVAILGGQFFAAPGSGDEDEFVPFALLSFLAYGAAALGSLAASLLTSLDSGGRRSRYLAPLGVIAVAAVAVVAVIVVSAL